ncbi:MAG: glycosyltransferase family 39 protein [Planctomycetaceae bacterium]|nr:glycosyltransferase family 39 protein [Planctomycetaceae bacterium]
MDITIDENMTAADTSKSVTEQLLISSERKNKASWTVWLLVTVIILTGLVFRFMLLNAFLLDFDESMHFQVAREASLYDAWNASRIHTHPPLAFLFYHYWIALGDSELMLRMPSLLFSIPALIFSFLWFREILGERPALIGLVFLTFSMPMIHLGALMRGYMLLLTFIYAALYLQERFYKTRSLWALAGNCSCLILAMLTHYSTAWLILALGLLGLLRVVSGTFSKRMIVGWVISQFVLLGVCLAFYFGHVHAFLKSTARKDLWEFWLTDSAYDPNTTHPVYLAMMRVMEFIQYLSGPLRIFIIGLLIMGIYMLFKKGVQENRSKWVAFERGMLVLIPFMVAMLLFHLRIYPVGHTRHSMWLVPFAGLAVAAGSWPLLKRPGLIKNGIAVVLILLWIDSFAYPNVWKLKTTQTPQMARQVVAVIEKTIPAGATILTDDSTRNVLEYYLVGRTVLHGKPLGNGYTEYEMDGYRVVTIPKFHFYLYNIETDWESFTEVFGPDSTEPLWLVYLGLETSDAQTSNVFKRFPPGKIIKRASFLDNQILQVQFQTP